MWVAPEKICGYVLGQAASSFGAFIGGITLILCGTCSPIVAASNLQATCADFLLEINRKPRNLEFVACQQTVKGGLPALEATYRVTGADAAGVEAYLVKTARMPMLRFLCCGWESVPRNPKTERRTGTYRHHGNQHEILMGSGEVTINQRARWAEISTFYVTATRYLDLP